MIDLALRGLVAQVSEAVAGVAPAGEIVARDGLDRRGLALLGGAHMSVDLCRAAVPALLPFFVDQRGYSYAAPVRSSSRPGWLVLINFARLTAADRLRSPG